MMEPSSLTLLAAFTLGCVLIHAARQFADLLTPVLAVTAAMLAAVMLGLLITQYGLMPPESAFMGVPLAYQLH